jgi:hypothetical protein
MRSSQRRHRRRLRSSGAARASVVTVLVSFLLLGMVSLTAAQDQVCPGTQVDVEDLPETIDGVTITLVSDFTVRFDIPEGTTVQVCVKAGSAEQGEGPQIFTLTSDTNITVAREISHVSVISVSTPTTPPPTTPPPTTPPPTTPPPTTPPPTTPPPTTPPPTTPPPTPEISVAIAKTNDADQDGTFTNNEEASGEGQAVTFHLVITNTSDETVEITELTDSFEQTVIDLLADECPALDGVQLDPGESVECTFTLPNYSPDADSEIVNVAQVCVIMVGGTPTACDTNPSRVTSRVILGRTVTPTPTGTAPTTTPPGGIAFTGPPAVIPLAGLALLLLSVGSGLLWVGARRRRPEDA